MLSNLHFGLEGILPLSVYIGMFVVFFLSVFKMPSAGLYLFILTLPLQTGRYKLHQFPLGDHFLDILLLGTILGMLMKREEIIPKTPWKKFFIVLAIFYYFSLWEGSLFIDVPLPLWISDDRFSDWKNYVEMFLLALIVANVFKEKAQIRNLIIVMCLSLLVVNRSYISLMSSRDLSHFSYDVRDAGPLGYAGVNGLAAFEAMLVSFLIGIYASVKKLLPRIAIIAVVCTCLYCLLYTFSRGGYLGMLAGIAVIGLFRMRWLLGLVVFVVLGWQLFLPSAVQERIMMTTGDADASKGEQFDNSAQTRIVLWEDAIELFKKNPITGSGFNTYEFMGRVGPYRDTHNYYIKVLAETGIVGLVFFMMLLWRLFKSGLSLFRESKDPFWQGIGLGFLGLLSSAIVLNFFGDRWTYQQVDGYLWVLLGCVVRGLIATSEQTEKEDASISQVAHTSESLDKEAVAV